MDYLESDGQEENGEQWLPVSDLMSVLMMVFLIIAISYMLKIQQEKDKIEEIAVTYNQLQNSLYEELHDEFRSDLLRWNAEIDPSTLSVRFKSPDILFSRGSANLRPKFLTILDDFVPRYINILYDSTFKESIEEIRIEGHTSSYWGPGVSETYAYMQNMRLSQDRTRNVLGYIINLEQDADRALWTRSHLTANGLSSSNLIMDGQGQEIADQSRRVEFKVKTNAEERIARIISQ